VGPANGELALTLQGLAGAAGQQQYRAIADGGARSKKSVGTLTVSLTPNVRPLLDKTDTKNLRQE